MTKPRPKVSTAEAYAIGACVTDRLLGRMTIGAFDATSKRLHPGRCRFCPEKVDALLALLADYGISYNRMEGTVYTDEARAKEAEWLALSKGARWRRMREAQEPAWFEEVSL